MAAILGLDLGEKRVGVAICDTETTIATPVETVQFKGKQQLLADLRRLVQEYQVIKIVVGLPMTLRGEIGPAAKKILEQVEWLKSQLPNDWVTWDERLSTKQAEQILLDADLRRDRRKEVRDKLAAQLILQNYIDYHRS